MQESFSITENWDGASSNKAVMWAISHVITNIHKHVKSEERQPKCQTGWGKAQKIEVCVWVSCVWKCLWSKTQKHCTLTCGRFSPRWSLQSVVYRSSLAASDRSSMPAHVPIENTYIQHIQINISGKLTETQSQVFEGPCLSFKLQILQMHKYNIKYPWEISHRINVSIELLSVCVSMYLTCVSVLGFQSGSKMMTLLAPVRLTPRPPTLVVNKKIKMDLSCKAKTKEMSLIKENCFILLFIITFGTIISIIFSNKLLTNNSM